MFRMPIGCGSPTIPDEYYSVFIRQHEEFNTPYVTALEQDLNELTSYDIYAPEDPALKCIRIATAVFDYYETNPIMQAPLSSKAVSTHQSPENVCELINFAQTLLENNSIDACSQIIKNLRCRIIAAQYRLHLLPAIEATDEESYLSYGHRLAAFITSWKDNNPLIEEKGFESQDRNLMNEICRLFPAFIKQILTDDALKDRFIHWCIVCRNDAEIFVKYPYFSQRIIDSNLAERVGGLASAHLLQIQPIQNKLHLVLKCNGQYESVLNEGRFVHVGNNRQLNFFQIFEFFRHKSIQFTNIECFQSGVQNWHPAYLAPQINGVQTELLPNSQDWYSHLPVVEELSLEQIQSRYGVKANSHDWVKVLHVTRSSPGMDILGTHALYEMLIPTNDNVKRLFPFGKFTLKFPETAKEKIMAIGSVLQGTVAYPDENIFNLKRQHGRYARIISPEKGLNSMAKIAADINRARQGNITFQILNDSCCNWAWQNFADDETEAIPQLLPIRFWDCDPSGTLGTVFSLLKKLSPANRNKFFDWTMRLLGAENSYCIVNSAGNPQAVRLADSPPWKEGNFFHHPAVFFDYFTKQIER